MIYIFTPIMEEIEALQDKAGKKGRHIHTVYLTEEEMDEFADECKASGMDDDPRKVPAHDAFRWRGTLIKLEQKP